MRWCARLAVAVVLAGYGPSAVSTWWGRVIEVPGLATLNTGAGGIVVSEENGVCGQAVTLQVDHYSSVDSISCTSPGNCLVGGWAEDNYDSPDWAYAASERNGPGYGVSQSSSRTAPGAPQSPCPAWRPQTPEGSPESTRSPASAPAPAPPSGISPTAPATTKNSSPRPDSPSGPAGARDTCEAPTGKLRSARTGVRRPFFRDGTTGIHRASCRLAQRRARSGSRRRSAV